MEVVVRAILAHTGENRNGWSFTFNALRDSVRSGLFEGAPCYLGHGAPRQSHRAQGRFKLGRWHQTEFNEDTAEVVGYMHCRFWLPVFSRLGFSGSFFLGEKATGVHQFVYRLYSVYSVDLVEEPGMQRARPLLVTVLNPDPPPATIQRRLSRLVTRETFLHCYTN